MKTEIFENYSAFLNRSDKDINGVDAKFAKAHPNYEEENSSNRGCWCCSKNRPHLYLRQCKYTKQVH